MDWGLFDGKFFLREELIYPKKVCTCMYACSVCVHACYCNVVLLLADLLCARHI